MKVFSLSEIAIHSYFVLSLGSLGFSAEIFPFITFFHRLFPSIWPGNSRLNGRLPSKFPKPKPLNQLKNGLILKNPNPKKTHVLSSSLPRPLSWPQTPSKTFFPSNSAYKAYLKRVKEQAAETLSQLTDSYDDNEDTASSSAFQQNEDMCYGLPYTPLE